jgi:hypothetical protein
VAVGDAFSYPLLELRIFRLPCDLQGLPVQSERLPWSGTVADQIALADQYLGLPEMVIQVLPLGQRLLVQIRGLREVFVRVPQAAQRV